MACTPKRHYGYSNSPCIRELDRGKLTGGRKRDPKLKVQTAVQYRDGNGILRYKGTKNLRKTETLDSGTICLILHPRVVCIYLWGLFGNSMGFISFPQRNQRITAACICWEKWKHNFRSLIFPPHHNRGIKSFRHYWQEPACHFSRTLSILFLTYKYMRNFAIWLYCWDRGDEINLCFVMCIKGI
jgi:hypothetical protein